MVKVGISSPAVDDHDDPSLGHAARISPEDAASFALAALAPAHAMVGERVAAFAQRFGGPMLDPSTLRIEGRPGSREAARAHAAAATELTGLLQSHPVAARVELVALP